MDFSIATLLISLGVFTVICILLDVLLAYRPGYRYFRSNVLIGLSIFAVIRLIMPCELWYTHTFQSKYFLPKIYDGLEMSLHSGPIKITVSLVLLAIWIIGVVVSFIRYTVAYRHLSKMLASATQLPNVIVRSDIQVKRMTASVSPFTFGMIHPIIVIPDSMVNKSELADVLQHEVKHIQNRDSFIKLLVQILSCVYWWFLPLRHFANQVDLILELRVDDQVNATKTQAERLDYLQSLISVEKRILSSNQIPKRSGMTSAFTTFTESSLARRIQFAIGGFSFRHTRPIIMALLVAIPLWMTSFIVEPYRVTSHVTMTSQKLDKNGFILRLKSGKYILYQNGHRFGKISNPHDPAFKNMKILQERR